jgi:hypothetical protein
MSSTPWPHNVSAMVPRRASARNGTDRGEAAVSGRAGRESGAIRRRWGAESARGSGLCWGLRGSARTPSLRVSAQPASRRLLRLHRLWSARSSRGGRCGEFDDDVSVLNAADGTAPRPDSPTQGGPIKPGDRCAEIDRWRV